MVTQEDSFSTIICKYCVRHLNDFHDFFQLVEEQQQVLQKEDFLEAKCIINDIGNGLEHPDKSLLDMKDVLVEGELYPEERLLNDIFAYDEHLNNVSGSDDEENIPLQSLHRETANETASNEKKNRPIRKTRLNGDGVEPEENKLRNGLVTIVHICDICKKEFKSSVLLKVHIERMHGETFVCETCGKEYRFKLFFDRHVALHQGEISDPTDKCPICGYALKSLRNHMKRHELEESKKKKFKKCGKTFKSKSALSTHVSYARGKKIFSCTYCEKNCTSSCSLKEHVAMHTGRKNYSCQYCTREFRLKSDMYSHIKKTHEEQWAIAKMLKYKCPNGNIKNGNA